MPEDFFEELKKIRLLEKKINNNLFWICSLVTIVLIGFYLLEFFSREKYLSPPMGGLYIGILILYSFHKELVRWLGEKEVERRGEWFVYLWIGITFFLYIFSFLSQIYFSNPFGDYYALKEMTFTTLEVSFIFIFTRFSKIFQIISKLRKEEKSRNF